MQSERPLLTIAIPTFNRSAFLDELLSILMPQLESEVSVELLISDNASTDNTVEVVGRYCSESSHFRVLRNTVNIGADANFLQCFREARGRYVWLVGDDDIIVPGAAAKIIRLLSGGDYDLVFVRPYAFLRKYDEVKVEDRLGRTAMVVRKSDQFAEMTGVMLTFISAVIVNKSRLNQRTSRDLGWLVGTNLIQLGWILPLLIGYEGGLIVYGGLVAGRRANSGGYDHAKVFGRNLKMVAFELLRQRPQLANRIVNNTLRCWFPNVVLELRRNAAGEFDYRNMDSALRPIFGDNLRYWIFVYPAIKAPLWMARLGSLVYGIVMRVEGGGRALLQLLINRRNQIAGQH